MELEPDQSLVNRNSNLTNIQNITELIGDVGDDGIDKDDNKIEGLESHTDDDDTTQSPSIPKNGINLETDQSLTKTNLKNEIRRATESTPIPTNNISYHNKDVSHLSHLSQTSQHSTSDITREMVEEFFYDDGGPYHPPPAHTLDESPCKSIIKKDSDGFYYCIMHPDFRNIHLETIEHNIKYKDAELHKSEILKSLNNYDVCQQIKQK